MFGVPCRRPDCTRRGHYRRGLCGPCYEEPAVRAEFAAPDRRPAPPGCCRHCRVNKINRPRNLCWTCYYTPGVKDQYPRLNYGRHDLEPYTPGHSWVRPIPEPTEAQPGTPEKLAVLEARHAAGQQLWHPLDANRSG